MTIKVKRYILLTLAFLFLAFSFNAVIRLAIPCFKLVCISTQNVESEKNRINPNGVIAANNTYDKNEEIRNQIYYHHPDSLVRWFTTSGDIIQILIVFVLLGGCKLSTSLINAYIKILIKRHKRRKQKRNQRRKQTLPLYI